jgi:hypothetical protein
VKKGIDVEPRFCFIVGCGPPSLVVGLFCSKVEMLIVIVIAFITE